MGVAVGLDGHEWTDVAAIPTSEPLRMRDSSQQPTRAVSAAEVWVAKSGTWHRYLDGTWTQPGPGTEGAVIASDGALWGWDHDYQAQKVRLVRQTGDGFRVLTTQYLRDIDSTPDHLYADSNGSVFVVDDGDVVEFQAYGTRQPMVTRRGWTCSSCEGWAPTEPYGSAAAWTRAGEDVGPVNEGWHRWDGRRWVAEQGPDPFVSSWLSAVTADGTGWALGGDGAGVGIRDQSVCRRS